MNDNSWIVVESRRRNEGTVLFGVEQRAQAEGQGDLLLPFGGDLGSGGSGRRHYGDAGVRFEDDRPMLGCSFPAFLSSRTMRIEWVARVDTARVSRGRLGIAAASGPNQARVVSVEGGEVGQVFQSAGRVRGSAIVTGAEGAYTTLCLGGTCTGVSVMWLAVAVLPT